MASVNNGGNGLAVFCAAGSATAPTFTVPTAGTGSGVVTAWGGAGPAAGAATAQGTGTNPLKAASCILFGTGSPLIVEAWFYNVTGGQQVALSANPNAPATIVAFAGAQVSFLIVDFNPAGATTMNGDTAGGLPGSVNNFAITVNALS